MLNVFPEWTEKPEKRGLDPLGMQNSGVVLYQSLLPGISNVTLRMRYYSYYCWVSETYGRSATSDPKDWQRWLRRAEALYALVAALDGSEPGVGGIDWAQRRLAMDEPEIDFAVDASIDGENRYLRQSMGVFGGAYFTQMMEMGLFDVNNHGIGVRTDDLGRMAADAFRVSVGGDLEALLQEKIQSARVTRHELALLRPIIPKLAKQHPVERQFLEQILFAKAPEATKKDRSRRASLTLLLKIADGLARRPREEDVRWHLFLNPNLTLDAELENKRREWEAYQCQDLLQVAAATLLAWAISLMGEVEGGRSLDEIQREIRSRLEESAWSEAGDDWTSFQGAIDELNYPYRDVWVSLTGRRGSPEERSWEAIRLMAALSRRLRERPELSSTVRSLLPSAGQARSIVTELDWLDGRSTSTVSDLFAEYISERVVRRHSWVAMQKLRRQRDYTFLFEVRDGRLAPLKSYQPVATTPRLSPAIQFLEDIDLIDAGGLTSTGRALLGANA